MSPEALSIQIVAGGLLGTLGQGVRVIAGLKKAHDSAAQQNQPLQIEPGTLLVSLFIGFTAGALGLLSTNGATPTDINQSTAFAIIAAGYAGTDFIEAFMKKYLPGDSSANTASRTQPQTNSTQEQPAVG